MLETIARGCDIGDWREAAAVVVVVVPADSDPSRLLAPDKFIVLIESNPKGVAAGDCKARGKKLVTDPDPGAAGVRRR